MLLYFPIVISAFSPSSVRVSIFGAAASRRAYRCHRQLLGPSVKLRVQCKMSPKRQIAITFALNIHSPQRMPPDDGGDHLTPPAIRPKRRILLVHETNYILFRWHEIYAAYSGSPEIDLCPHSCHVVFKKIITFLTTSNRFLKKDQVRGVIWS